MKQYGVMEGVFTKQELVSDNIKEKEDKIAFLQKLINHISMTFLNLLYIFQFLNLNACTF